jgi:hypothetical protein
VRSRFWLSSPVDFNDPFDMSAKFIVIGTPSEKRRRIKEILNFQGRSWSEQRKLLPRLMAKADEELARLGQAAHQKYVERAGVYSFGGDPRNILMWSHYAGNHSGVCLLFEVARDIETFAHTVTMKYSQDYPVINWVTGFHEGLVAVIERKHEGWRYEKETRIVHYFETARRYVPFKPEALQAVIIGCRATGEAINQLNELISERRSHSLSLPKLYCALQHESKYKLVIKRIANMTEFIRSRNSTLTA